jgi:nitrogen fixation NifU-like protein
MSDLTDLYQDVILDHNRRPRNFGTLDEPALRALGHNPLCGDRLMVFARLDEGVIREIRFEGSGCAISKASASLMTEAVKGQPVTEALALFERFQALVTTPIEHEVDLSQVGKLGVLAGVREFPMRVKCATLAWHTLKSVLLQKPDIARTE